MFFKLRMIKWDGDLSKLAIITANLITLLPIMLQLILISECVFNFRMLYSTHIYIVSALVVYWYR